MNPSYPSSNGQPPRSWFRRNWLWFIPLGCLSSIVLVAGFVAAIAYMVMSGFKASEPYQVGLAQAVSNPEVVARLGEPIEPSFFATGTMNLENSDGEADLVIPISGPNGKAMIYVEAEKEAGNWSYSRIAVEFSDTGDQIRIEAPHP